MNPCNREDLMDKLQEEAAEVIQAASKCKRFGPEQVHPKTGIRNKDALATEIGQLMLAIDDVLAAEDISPLAVSIAYQDKKETRHLWDQFNVKKGAVGA
jgi:phosphoribosyl-ATP pyrophosphohydrolase